MKKRWIVLQIHSGYRDDRVLGVFRSRKRANEYYAALPDGRSAIFEVSVPDYRIYMSMFRRQVFERDGLRCVKCARSLTWDTGELHEKIPRGKTGDRTVENCELRCHDCHTGRKGAHGFGAARKRIGV
jgi:hypothetical protein